MLRNQIIVALAALFVACFYSHAHADIYSIITNPGEDCSTQMNIGWHADLDNTNVALVYTTRSDLSWAHAITVPGSFEKCELFDGINSKTPAGADWKEDAQFLDFSVSLNRLKPDTQYMYKVESATAPTESPVHYFKTAGAKEFSFLWISDIHAYTPLPNRLKNANAILDAAAKIDPTVDFVFATGDVVAWGGSYSFWKYLFDQPFARNYMFADVIGNHDWMRRSNGGSSDYFRIAHHNPTNGYAGQEGVCYWFIYGDVLFLTFDNELMRTGPEAEATAKTWAAGVIEKQKGKYQKIFIAEHYHWFDGQTGKANWYAHWKEFCDKYGVTLALAGHDHIYERTYPLRDDQVVTNVQGTVYMVAPSSDGERGLEAGTLTTNAEKLAFTYSSHTHSNPTEVKTIGCVLVHVSPNAITTKLVYLDDNRAIQVADEHIINLEKK
ncbi:MAG TPA: FN3 domain-containing metallophosphoesterase family protein [Verrucomicrobiae bacterium]|nr:FN3 domain-containing metallophosphoesterase family protein [Verrucomicrobiae bacterium]